MSEPPAFTASRSAVADKSHEGAQGFSEFRRKAVYEAQLAEREYVAAAGAVVGQRSRLVLGEQSGGGQPRPAREIEVQRMIGKVLVALKFVLRQFLQAGGPAQEQHGALESGIGGGCGGLCDRVRGIQRGQRVRGKRDGRGEGGHKKD